MRDREPENDTPVGAGQASEWNWNPDLPVPTSPVFAWPPRPAEAVRWLASYWLTISAVTLELALAIGVYLLLQPEWQTMQSLAPGWIAQIWFRNICLMFLIAGGLHLVLYTFRLQDQELKFDARDLARDNGTYTFRSQVLDNMFWTLASGVTCWTFYEVLLVWAAANGHIPVIRDVADSPLWFVVWLVLIPIWSSLHFYWIHRLLHWPPLYRLAHALHHRNINIGPWTGTSMHPVEHALYYSSVLIHLVVPSHPVHILFHLYVQSLNPAFSHSGFDAVLVRDKRAVEAGDFFHQLHHRYFECNYGTVEMPWDRWFGSFHNGTPEANQRVKERRRRIMQL